MGIGMRRAVAAMQPETGRETKGECDALGSDD